MAQHDAAGSVEVPVRRLDGVPRRLVVAAAALVILGVVAFVAALSVDADRAWRAYLFNWLFFASVAQGAVMLAAAVSMTRGVWSRPIRRIALSFVAFLPIVYLLVVPLFFGADVIFPWVEHPVPGKEPYLNVPFLVARHVVMLGAILYLSLRFAYWALRPDAGLIRDEAPPALRGLYDRLTRGWQGQEEEEVRAQRKLARLGPALALVYAAAFSFVAWDFVMSLEPHWWSTLIGPYFFMAAFLGGVAATAIATVYYRRRLGLEAIVEPPQFHDLGKLVFAFCVFWAYLFWSQFIVIWYGLLPFEQIFVIHRFSDPFSPVAVLVFAFLFVLPFFGLLGVAPKRTPRILAFFASIVLVGLWLERYLLVYPSYYFEADTLPFGWPEVGLALPFLGLLLFALARFASRFPMVQLWQPPSELDLLGPGTEPIDQVVTAE